MARQPKNYYACSVCGHQTSRWMGRCPECQTWDSMEEKLVSRQDDARKSFTAPEPQLLVSKDVPEEERYPSGITVLDEVLGGGIVSGSLVIIGGDPGIGKSTLMLQMLQFLPEDKTSFYISGEESMHQIQQRARRLGVTSTSIFFLNETNLENISATLRKHQPQLVVIDSVQTLASENIDGIPGNSSQLRYCTSQLVKLAKSEAITIFLVGHVTKDGAIAGPKILEHLVDTVLYFEGEHNADYRILRTIKNRFGAVNELALFRMERRGLIPVENPSELFLDPNRRQRSGNAVVAVMEGNRPLLIEVQALVSKTQFGMPQRTATGIDHRRMNLLLAVLEKKCAKPFGFHDVFLKTAAGLRLDEPAADLGICMALYSSLEEQILPENTAYIGEVGLNGELRAVSNLQERIREAENLGFSEIIIPFAHRSIKTKGAKLRMIDEIQQLVR